MTHPVRVRPATLLLAAAAAGTLCALLGAAPGRRLDDHLTVLGVKLESATMADVRRRLGDAPLVHNGGDAASSRTHLCYRAPDGTVLVFRCWECGSPEERRGTGATLQVDELWLARGVEHVDWGAAELDFRVPDAFAPSCAATRRISAATALGRLTLGMSRADVVRALGPPERDAPGVLEYSHGRPHLTVLLARGKVVAIRGALWWE